VKLAIPQVKLPKAPPKARALAIVVMTVLVLGSIFSVWSDFPFNGNPVTWLRAKEMYLDGMEMRKRFMLPGALQKFEKAVEKYPQDPHFQFSLAEALERQERYKEAEDHFQQAVKVN